MAIRYNKNVWTINDEILSKQPEMEPWKDEFGNIVDFEKEKQKGHTGFLYKIVFPNGQFYSGSKLICRKVHLYKGSGKLVFEYVDKYGTAGIKRTVISMHSCDKKELVRREKIFLIENDVVAKEEYLNITDETGRADYAYILSTMGRIVATDKNGQDHFYENDKDAIKGISKIVGKELTAGNLVYWLRGSSLVFEKYLKDIRLMDASAFEHNKLDEIREERREKNKVSSVTRSIAIKKRNAENPEIPERIRQSQKKFWSKPENRRKNGEIQKKHHAENPDRAKKASESMKQVHKENPELGIKTSERNLERHADPENRRKQSEAIKKFQKENPEIMQRAREKLIITANTPEFKKAASERAKKMYIENPEIKTKISETQRKNGKNKKDGIIYFKNGRIEKFRGVEKALEILDIKKNVFSSWTMRVTRSFIQRGIIKIEFNGRTFE